MSDAYIETTYKGPVGSLKHRCQHCKATDTELFKCAGCHAARYCSRNHQVADRPQHKRLRKTIKEARAETAKEERLLRNADDEDTPANTFETAAGLFWGYKGTRDYMCARMRLAKSYLLRSGSLDGVREALDHMLDMIRLCRGDNVGMRQYVPGAMLRLYQDQECYDFIKWWATCDPDGKYNWSDVTLPHLNLRGADIFEDPDFLMTGLPGINHLVAILLLKLKLLIDVRKILAHRKGAPLAPLRSPISVKLQDKDEHQQAPPVDLASPQKALVTTPETWMMGTPEESALAVQNSYAAFWTTEGTLDLLKELRG
ncbi:hypothetical protein F5X68DRAFT_230407 [Plectosphaerella plurivora]|uniref:MYND-type domain-containing protein n=1 Tax=Plectosphaerella plurivora TaxID=936078 RepID=A0A9P8VGC0_9PEZI|nr:hypothetical protein F5X68DRAFT_230407 [Plectosphaerella plurivora]